MRDGVAEAASAMLVMATATTRARAGTRTKVHRNSHDSQAPNHGYEIFLIAPLLVSRIRGVFNPLVLARLRATGVKVLWQGDIAKVGISHSEDGNLVANMSARAIFQINELFHPTLSPLLPTPIYHHRVIMHFPNRATAAAWEKMHARALRGAGFTMHRHTRPSR